MDGALAMAEGCGEGRSAFAFHEIERVSEPMRIGRHEWRLVAYWRAGMEYIDGGLWEEVERRLVGYEWRPAGGQGAWREVRNRASGGRGICQATRGAGPVTPGRGDGKVRGPGAETPGPLAGRLRNQAMAVQKSTSQKDMRTPTGEPAGCQRTPAKGGRVRS